MNYRKGKKVSRIFAYSDNIDFNNYSKKKLEQWKIFEYVSFGVNLEIFEGLHNLFCKEKCCENLK